MSWEAYLALLPAALCAAVIVGGWVGRRTAEKRERPPVPRCRHCTSPLGETHTGYCPRSRMRGGAGGYVVEEDL